MCIKGDHVESVENVENSSFTNINNYDIMKANTCVLKLEKAKRKKPPNAAKALSLLYSNLFVVI